MPGDAPSLRELQKLFMAGVTRPGGPAATLTALVAGTPALTPAGRLEIYGDMYFARLHDTLGADFPKLAAVLGDGGFLELVRAYLVAHPPTHFSLREAGRQLPGFLHQRDRGPPWLTDLAALEWARVDAFDAEDAAALDVAALRALAQDALPGVALTPVPSLQQVSSAWAVDEVWAALEARRPWTVPAAAPRTLLIWRREGVVYHRAADEIERSGLPCLRAGATVVELCEQLDRADLSEAEVTARAVELLLRWTEGGVVRAAHR